VPTTQGAIRIPDRKIVRGGTLGWTCPFDRRLPSCELEAVRLHGNGIEQTGA